MTSTPKTTKLQYICTQNKKLKFHTFCIIQHINLDVQE